jgi:HAD superfamily hydrolase (TIGR01490 family)
MPESVDTPSERPIIAFFDVDNTLLRGASIFHLGVGAFKKRLISVNDIARFGRQQVSFMRVGENEEHVSAARDKALSLAGGHSVSEVVDLSNQIWETTISKKLWPETVELAREHMRKGHEVWLITATPQIVAQVISDRLGFTGALGTIAEERDGVFTGRLVGPLMHGAHKAEAAGELARSLNADLSECWAYSDSSNDLPLLTLVGHQVVVNPDAALSRHAKAEGWSILILKPASIREARRRVRREARTVRRQNPARRRPRRARP